MASGVSVVFPAAAHLTRTADYRRVYDHGTRRQYGWLMAFILKTGSPVSRVGLTLPSRFGNAVKRNRMKRRLRHGIAACMNDLPAGWDIVLHPRTAGLTLDFDELITTLRRLFSYCAKTAPFASSVGRPAADAK